VQKFSQFDTLCVNLKEAQKKGVDVKIWRPYKPLFARTEACFLKAPELRFQLFDIVRDWKRNAGGVSVSGQTF